jgi:cyclopropane fatty-acyl-phospholipid synthase-like methyltransferase
MTRTAPSTRTGRTGQSADPRVLAHFQASAALYRLWSREGHLHFGYWRWPMSPLDRAAMLDELVHQVVRTLQPMPGERLADLGCGYGASARLVAGTYATSVDAFTIVEQQVMEGQREADRERVDVTMHLRDFRHTGLPAASMDGLYALESLCYGSGRGKDDVLAEAARVLRPRGRIALVDGFISKEPQGFRRRMVRTVEEGWAVPCFPREQHFLAAMTKAGFTDIAVRDLSWHVAPSALHGLPLMAWTELKRVFTGVKLDPLERAHLRSCLFGIALGTQRDLFRYLLITGRKR